MRRALVALALASLLGCAEEAEGVQPLPVAPSARPASVAEPPAPAIVSPHLRRAEAPHGTASAGLPLGGGGGGGGGRSSDWTPRTEPPPTQREVDQFHARLEDELRDRVDPTDDPCDQMGDVMRANVEARDGDDRGLPGRAELRERCRNFPEAYRRCMSQEYFGQHIEECNQELARLAERGERRSRQARRQMERGEDEAPPRGAPEDG